MQLWWFFKSSNENLKYNWALSSDDSWVFLSHSGCTVSFSQGYLALFFLASWSPDASVWLQLLPHYYLHNNFARYPKLLLSNLQATGCSSKFWIDFKQKSWILKMFQVASSAEKPWCHWIIGLKIKSYYQTLPFWWKLDKKKAVLYNKISKFI